MREEVENKAVAQLAQLFKNHGSLACVSSLENVDETMSHTISSNEMIGSCASFEKSNETALYELSA